MTPDRPTRCEIADLYFWLGKDAEVIGFTPWQTAWLAYPTTTVVGWGPPTIFGARPTRRINDSGLWEHVNVG